MEVNSDKPEVLKSEDYEVIEHDVSDKLVKVLETASSTRLKVDEFEEKDADALEDKDFEDDDEELSHLKPQKGQHPLATLYVFLLEFD